MTRSMAQSARYSSRLPPSRRTPLKRRSNHTINNSDRAWTMGIVIPTHGPEDWQQLLAEPDKHWRTGYSARSLAYSWEEAQSRPSGMPTEVESALAQEPRLAELELLLGIPEHEVPLPGGRRPSQTDLWGLARSATELVSIAVEGKVSEMFGPTLEEWQAQPSSGKQTRLDFLCECLALPMPPPGTIRYQLLHRTASAVIEAKRFQAGCAVLLIHSFSQTNEWFEDYRNFIQLYGVDANEGHPVCLAKPDGVMLYAVWVKGNPEYLTR